MNLEEEKDGQASHGLARRVAALVFAFAFFAQVCSVGLLIVPRYPIPPSQILDPPTNIAISLVMNDPRCPPKVIDLLDPTFLVLQEVFASQNKILPVPIPGIPPFNPALIKNFWDADAELPVINGDFELALNMHHFFAGPDAQRDADSQIAVNPPSQIASSSAVSTAQDVMNSPSRSPVSSASSSPYPASDYSADPPSRQMAPAHDHDCGSHEAQTPESGYAMFKFFLVFSCPSRIASAGSPSGWCSPYAATNAYPSSNSVRPPPSCRESA
ncbi:hypothetical protein CERSUDRAFT_96441 [Gelatoporia subvermispora B]|uniref:Uncharacterized protein n=1 Tax=Ceriporiopsis subvermispora (strain B) TaxID=914234 RepID=M2QE43_CERS8|nr:hypothetical protein CERSUDRAFT_96441 [Gelatoporia subvermispora B]